MNFHGGRTYLYKPGSSNYKVTVEAATNMTIGAYVYAEGRQVRVPDIYHIDIEHLLK
jgi:hypothetical protein